MKKAFILIIVLMAVKIMMADDFYDMNTINTIELTFEESNWDAILDNYYEADQGERLLATAVINGVQYDSVGVRYKGNSSYKDYQVKNPLNIKLDYVIEDQDIDGYGTIKLANGYMDPSYVRETLAYEIARQYMPAGKSNYANVYINGSLIGIYTSSQDVDKKFMREHLSDTNDVRFKGEIVGNGMPSEEVIWGYEGSNPDDYTYLYEIESDEGWEDLIEFLDVLNNDTDNIEDYLNVDNHLWMLAFDNLTVNLDAPINFAHNYYLIKDDTNRFNPVIWDLNMAFGGFSQVLSGGWNGNLSASGKQQLDPMLNVNDNTYPIVNKILTNDTYKKMYIAHIRTMIEDIFESGWFETRAYELQDLIYDDYNADQNKFYTTSQLSDGITSIISEGWGPQAQTIVGLTYLMNTRCSWLQQQSEFSGTVPTIENNTIVGNEIFANSTASFNVEAYDVDQLWLYYRSSSYDKYSQVEMFDDGSHNDGQANDGIYGAEIEVGYSDLEYYFWGENSSQGSFLPSKSAFQPYVAEVRTETGNIVINEINYNSSDEFDSGDWLELYNPGQEEINISGWIFKDEDDDHSFEIPENTILAADSYLVLTKDSESFTALFPEVTNYVGDFDFGLAGGGELLRLYDGNATLIDSVLYEDEGDWSTLPDGQGNTLELIDANSDNYLAENWQASMGNGTPGSANSSGVTPNSDESVQAVTMELSNYPNPFNPQTTISYNITENGKVKLTVFNAKGQVVKTLVNASQNSGKHTVVWDGHDNRGKKVSSGLYFYRLENAGNSKINKMIMMK